MSRLYFVVFKSICCITGVFSLVTVVDGQVPPAAIEEVYIFSRSTQESLDHVPITVAVANSDAIHNTGAQTLSDLEAFFPSLSFGRSSRRTRGELGIRGVSDYSRNIGSNARVAVYIDEVLTGRSASFDADLSHVQQVEVLSGPQGTLFGANSVAGAVNITTRPISEERVVDLSLDAGNRNYRRASVYASSALSATTSASLLYADARRDGWIRNVYLNEDLQNLDKQSAMLKFKWAPTEQFSLSWNSDWLTEEANATNDEALEYPLTFGGGSDLAAPAPREVSHNTDEFEQRDIWGSALIARYHLDQHELVSITAYRDVAFREQSEEDYTNSQILPDIFSVFGETTEQYSQEVKWIKDNDQALNYVAGLYFLQQRIATDRFASLNTLRVDAPGLNRFYSVAGYAHLTYDVSPVFGLEAGVRLTRESSQLQYTVQDRIGNFGFIDSTIDDKQTITEPTGSLSAHWSPTEQQFAYATVARGFKRGGWNADFVTSLDNIDYDPEYVTSVELGYKLSDTDNRWQTSLAVFHANYTDFQVFQFVPDNGFTSPVLNNAGEATTQGIEWTGRFSFNDDLRLMASYAYTDAEFDRFTNADSNGSDFSGNTLPYAPKEKYFLALNHSLQLPAPLRLDSYLDYGYQSPVFSNPNNTDANRISGFYTLNARISLHHELWSAALWANNLTDEDHLKQQNVSFLGVRRGSYEEPRTYGASLSYKFMR